MPRRPRVSSGGFAYHLLNRAVGRSRIFFRESDYLSFEKVLDDVHRRLPTRLLAYCLMPNHWHLVAWPASDGELSEFMRLVTVTHTQRWHAHHHSAGAGPIYQGRFKSFPIEQDPHLLTVIRYAERNALRAGLVQRAQDWRWGSLHHHVRGSLPAWLLPAHEWPVNRRDDWTSWVNRAQTHKEEEAIRKCVRRGAPYGHETWVIKTAKVLRLDSTLTPRGRPRKFKNES